MEYQSLIGLSDKDYSNMICRLNTSRAMTESNHVLVGVLHKTS